MYFQADDHYTHVYLLSGGHMLIPFGISKVEAVIGEVAGEDKYHLRLGRKHILNMRAIFHVNTIRQVVQLYDDHGNVTSIQLPKHILRAIIEYITNRPNQAD